VSDGLVAPLNAPGAALPAPGVQPGTTPGIVLAQYVIVFGPAGGVFVYSGTPGAGNSPIAWMTAATADPYGNTVTPEIGVGQDGGPQVILGESAAGGYVEFPVPGTFFRPAEIFASANGTGGALFIEGPADSSEEAIVFVLQSKNALGMSATYQLIYYDPAGGGHVQMQGTWAGMTLSTVASLAAVSPATGLSETNPAAAETWHTMALASGWTVPANRAAPSYRLLPTGDVELAGFVTRSSFTSDVAVNSAALAAAYQPQTTKSLTQPTAGAGGIQVSTAGVVDAVPLAGGSTQVSLDGLIYTLGV
jgi:hypothetical protein